MKKLSDRINNKIWWWKRDRKIKKYGKALVTEAEDKRLSVENLILIKNKRDDKFAEIKKSKETITFNKEETKALSEILYTWKTLAPQSDLGIEIETSIFRKVISLCPDLLLQLRKDEKETKKTIESFPKVVIDAFELT